MTSKMRAIFLSASRSCRHHLCAESVCVVGAPTCIAPHAFSRAWRRHSRDSHRSPMHVNVSISCTRYGVWVCVRRPEGRLDARQALKVRKDRKVSRKAIFKKAESCVNSFICSAAAAAAACG